MTVYVESNFLLEVAFEQEQSIDCIAILEIAEAGNALLAIPTFCVGECLERIGRRKQRRRAIQESINLEVNELSRSPSAATLCDQLEKLATALTENTGIDEERFERLLLRLPSFAHFIPFDARIIRNSLEVQTNYPLKSQDAIVFSSVLTHLRETKPSRAVFVNRNRRDFDTREIATDLQQLNCSYKPSFAAGLAYIRAELGRVAEIDHP